MDNLKDIQNITGLTSEAIFNIRKPVDYMCSDIDCHIKISRHNVIILWMGTRRMLNIIQDQSNQT